MPPVVRGYEFAYETPTVVDGQTVDIPSMFVLSGISEDVAKGIRHGLRQVPSIKNVVASRVLDDRDTLPSGTT